MSEIWKPCKTYEGLEASSLGRIRKDSKVLSQTPSSNGYVTTRVNRTNVLSQWIVADAFLGLKPDGMDVCHRNGNRKDNRPKNLRYDTRSNNLMDSWDSGVSRGRSSYLGATFSKREGKWKAYYDGGSKRKWLGTFSSEIEAARKVNSYITENNLNRRLNPC